ncbi:MAG: 50S ribosomal protein L24 [Acidobacteria bacterium]|nr:50S ribosomal protein L24 [Acidobacteriota bacterium]
MKKVIKKGTIRSKIKRGDQVVFVAGKEYNRYDSNGKRNPASGRVIAVDPRAHKVKVEGAMIVKKHQKANPQLNQEGGILKREAWVNVSNVAIVDPKTGEATRIGYEIRDGKKVRIAKKSGSVIPEPGIFNKPAATEEAEAPAEAVEPAEEVKEEAPKKPKKKAAKKEKKDTEE